MTASGDQFMILTKVQDVYPESFLGLCTFIKCRLLSSEDPTFFFLIRQLPFFANVVYAYM